MTQVALRPAPCTSLGLPLKKRKSKFDKDSEPPVAVLCENGLAICKSLGINSAHLKRTSNCPHVAVTITHPETEKRKSIALWKIITARVEAGWSVQYLNGDATDLRIENLKTVAPGERDTQADADTKHIVELNAKLRALPLSAEQQAKVQRQTEVFERLTSEEQKAFHAYLCGAARKSIKTNFRLVEDVVSEIFASEVWPSIASGKCNYETFEGMRAYAAKIVAFHAGVYAKLASGSHWGDFVPDRPKKMAEHGIKLLEFNDFTDAAYADINCEIPARPTRSLGTADEQTFGQDDED